MIRFFSNIQSERLVYAVEVIFKHWLGKEIVWIKELDDIERDSEIPLINYSDEVIEQSFHIAPSAMFLEKTFTLFSPREAQQTDFPVLFPADSGDVPFDVIGAVFWMISRYEEHNESAIYDKHGRYSSLNSWSEKKGVLQRPIVDEWVFYLKEKLKEKFPQLVFPSVHTVVNLTVDVDNAYAYINKPWWRTMAAHIKTLVRGPMERLDQRRNVFAGKERDPYDTYDYIEKVCEDFRLRPLFFFLLGDYGRYDRALPYHSRPMEDLIQSVMRFAEVGIHPSYASFLKEERVLEEIDRLATIAGPPVVYSRQHFLRLRIPDSYRILERGGIEQDHTLGYADQPGFRAGTSRPFPFFDLKENRKTNLWIFPLLIMDGTLNEYLELSPDEALKLSKQIIDEVKKYGGVVSLLWHNETVNDQGKWAGWREVFEGQLKYALY